MPSTRNPATARPCGGGANAAGAVGGKAGIATTPGANRDNAGTGVPALPPIAPPDTGGGATLNPSVRAGVPGSC